MRFAIPLLGALFVGGLVACTFPDSFGRTTQPTDENLVWRRTANGWEAIQWWRTELHREPPVPHPAVVGILQVLIAATIGVASLPAPPVAGHSSANPPSP